MKKLEWIRRKVAKEVKKIEVSAVFVRRPSLQMARVYDRILENSSFSVHPKRILVVTGGMNELLVQPTSFI